MRIFYGLSGDGLGHAMRARVIAAHLLERGHEVRLASWGPAAALLRRHGFSVIEVGGLSAHYERGRVRRTKTAVRMLRETPARVVTNARALLEQAESFVPDIAITDFNGFACVLGHVLKVPTLSIDHQHVLDRFQQPRHVVAGFAADFAVARALVSAKTPRCHRYLVTSFFFPEARHGTTTSIFGPVMRPELTRLSPTRGDHIVVYQTAGGASGLLAALRSVQGLEFRVYGYGAPCRVGNVVLRCFDEGGFLADLAGARAVITNGGFTAIAEALYLGKPVLSVPLPGQAEQQLNAAWLAELGLGMRAPQVDRAQLRRFIDRLPDLPAGGDARLRTGTRDALATIDRALAEVG